MKCGICASENRPTDAVALCRHCFIGLCLSHLAEAQSEPGPGGLNFGCPHQLVLRQLPHEDKTHAATRLKS